MDDVAARIIDILRKHMKRPIESISLETPLRELEIESLDLAMIVFDIEDASESRFRTTPTKRPTTSKPSAQWLAACGR